MHVIAAKAVCLAEAMTDEFKAYQQQVIKNAKALCDGLLARGMQVVSGGTDNHLILLDLSDRDVSGKDLEIRLDEVGITANKNTVPGEQRSPFVTSGLRLGSPAVTTRGFTEEDMDAVAECIALMAEDEANADSVRAKVRELTAKYPLV